MNRLVTALACVFLMLSATQYCLGKEWRGLTPLRSTKADVVRLFKQCADEKEACVFTLGDENVYILFSSALADDHAECAKRLPADTIIFIDVELTKPRKVDSLRLDKKKFRTFNPSEPVKRNLKGYWSEDEGFLINSWRGKVIEQVYLAAPTEKSLCSNFYSEPESFIRMVPVHVPVMDVTCLPDVIRAGERIIASASANVNAKRGYTWSLSAGRIISGQHTHRITVDTFGVSQRSLILTAEHRDVLGHIMLASCTVWIQQSPLVTR